MSTAHCSTSVLLQMISFNRTVNQTSFAQSSDPLTQCPNPFTCEAPKGLAETREQYGKGFPSRRDTPVKGLNRGIKDLRVKVQDVSDKCNN